MLPPQFRLRSSDDVGHVRKNGQRRQHPLVVLFVYRQSQELPESGPVTTTSRFAFAVGRHIGKAAQRNRVKRRLRAIVRQYLDQLEPGHDCLLVARSAAATADFDELDKAVLQLLSSGGLLVENRTNSELRRSSI